MLKSRRDWIILVIIMIVVALIFYLILGDWIAQEWGEAQEYYKSVH